MSSVGERLRRESPFYKRPIKIAMPFCFGANDDTYTAYWLPNVRVNKWGVNPHEVLVRVYDFIKGGRISAPDRRLAVHLYEGLIPLSEPFDEEKIKGPVKKFLKGMRDFGLEVRDYELNVKSTDGYTSTPMGELGELEFNVLAGLGFTADVYDSKARKLASFKFSTKKKGVGWVTRYFDEESRVDKITDMTIVPVWGLEEEVFRESTAYMCCVETTHTLLSDIVLPNREEEMLAHALCQKLYLRSVSDSDTARRVMEGDEVTKMSGFSRVLEKVDAEFIRKIREIRPRSLSELLA